MQPAFHCDAMLKSPVRRIKIVHVQYIQFLLSRCSNNLKNRARIKYQYNLNVRPHISYATQQLSKKPLSLAALYRKVYFFYPYDKYFTIGADQVNLLSRSTISAATLSMLASRFSRGGCVEKNPANPLRIEPGPNAGASAPASTWKNRCW